MFNLFNKKKKEEDEDCPMILLEAKTVKEWRSGVTQTLIEQWYWMKTFDKNQKLIIKLLTIGIALIVTIALGIDFNKIIGLLGI